MNIDLTIVIPLYNDKDKVKVCLQSIKEHTGKLNIEVIVVDNASSDGGPEMISQEFPWVKLVRNEENRYFNGANNQGFELATGKYCMTLNQDTEIKDNALEVMVDYLENHQDVGMVSCQLYYPDGQKQNNCWKFRGVFGIIANSQLSRIFGKLAPGLYQRIYRNLRYMDIKGETREVDTIMGACMMCPTHLLHEIRGFDEDIMFGYTDDVLCIKVRRKNFKIVHLSSGVIIHHETKQFKSSPVLIRIKNRDLINYARRYVGFHSLLVLYPLNFISKLIIRS